MLWRSDSYRTVLYQYSLQMAKHNFVKNMKCMHKKEYCKYNIECYDFRHTTVIQEAIEKVTSRQFAKIMSIPANRKGVV